MEWRGWVMHGAAGLGTVQSGQARRGKVEKTE